MKKLAMIFFVFFALTTVVTVAAEQEVTIFVDNGYKPYSFEEKGKPKGMYIDVLKTAFSRMKGFKVIMKPQPWDRGKKMMKNGKGFGLTPAFFHGHDWPYLYPYSLGFYQETIVVICDEKVLEKNRPNWPDDYIGLKIGNVKGYDGWGGKKFHELVKKGKIQYDYAKSQPLNIKKLGAKRSQCILAERKSFEYELKKMKAAGKYDEGGKHVKIKEGAIVGQDYVYIGYSKPAREAKSYPFQDEFMQKFDSVIYQMIKSGEVDKIMSEYKD